MADVTNARGIIAVDKMGAKVLFLDPVSYRTERVIDGFARTVHELLVLPETGFAYVPIFGDGIHGRNPHPQHHLCVIDLAKRALAEIIDLYPYIAPHTLKRGPDGLIYITCENSAKVVAIDPASNKVVAAIDTGSTNAHRLIIAPDGARLYTENEEDATISVIDLPARKLLGKIETPHPLAGIAIAPAGDTVIAVDDSAPALFLIDTRSGRVRDEVVLRDVPKPAQIARYAPDFSLLAVTSLSSDTVSLIDPSFQEQTAIKVLDEYLPLLKLGQQFLHVCQHANPLIHGAAADVVALLGQAAQAFFVTVQVVTQPVQLVQPLADLRQQRGGFLAAVMFIEPVIHQREK